LAVHIFPLLSAQNMGRRCLAVAWYFLLFWGNHCISQVECPN
jgi:hypothetical protein